MNELMNDNPVASMQSGMLGAQKIQQGNDEHQSAQIMQQLHLAQIADANYQQQVTKTVALGQDAYSQGLDSDAWKNFQKNNGGIAKNLMDTHATTDSKNALLKLSAIKQHGVAVGSSLLPIRTMAEYNDNYPTIAKMINDNPIAPGLKAPAPNSFKSDKEVSDWVDGMQGKTVAGIKMASASGKYIQDRIELIKEHGVDSPEVKQLDSDHQAYLDNQKAAHMPKDKPTGTIPPSASKAMSAQLSKDLPDLEESDRAAMIGVAGPKYMDNIKQGMQPSDAMNKALAETKQGLITDKHLFGDSQHFDGTKVGGTAPSPAHKVGDMIDVKGAGSLKITKIENGTIYVMHNGKERPINP